MFRGIKTVDSHAALSFSGPACVTGEGAQHIHIHLHCRVSCPLILYMKGAKHL